MAEIVDDLGRVDAIAVFSRGANQQPGGVTFDAVVTVELVDENIGINEVRHRSLASSRLKRPPLRHRSSDVITATASCVWPRTRRFSPIRPRSILRWQRLRAGAAGRAARSYQRRPPVGRPSSACVGSPVPAAMPSMTCIWRRWPSPTTAPWSPAIKASRASPVCAGSFRRRAPSSSKHRPAFNPTSKE